MKNFYNSNNEPNPGRFRLFAIFGILFFFIGLASLTLTVIDLLKGRASAYNYNESAGGLKTENPLWPSAGKGFWVGLILMTTGVIGILSSREGTRTSIIGFTALSVASTILSFYMMITCIIPLQNDTKSSLNPKPRWQSTELLLNALLTATGAIGAIIGTIASIFGCIHADCCVDQRDSYLIDSNVDQAKLETPSLMQYPTVNVSAMNYPYQQTNLRIPM